ncbi:hypothetical protein ACU8L2_31235 (plasmid) [Rhizobium leguminosarum]
MKGLIAPSLLPIPFGGSSKEFTSWLFLREVSSHPGWNNLCANGLQQANADSQPSSERPMPLKALAPGQAAAVADLTFSTINLQFQAQKSARFPRDTSRLCYISIT